MTYVFIILGLGAHPLFAPPSGVLRISALSPYYFEPLSSPPPTLTANPLFSDGVRARTFTSLNSPVQARRHFAFFFFFFGL